MGEKWPKEKMERWVTVYTDAGWKEGHAKLGFIARGTVAPVWLSGNRMVEVPSVATAEAAAVLHALSEVAKAFTHPRGLEGFFLRSDNLQVVQALQAQTQGRKRQRLALERIREAKLRQMIEHTFHVCREREWSLLVKHVLAHGREADRKRRWMNARADKLGNMRGVAIPTTKPRKRIEDPIRDLDLEDLDRYLIVGERS